MVKRISFISFFYMHKNNIEYDIFLTIKGRIMRNMGFEKENTPSLVDGT